MEVVVEADVAELVLAVREVVAREVEPEVEAGKAEPAEVKASAGEVVAAGTAEAVAGAAPASVAVAVVITGPAALLVVLAAGRGAAVVVPTGSKGRTLPKHASEEGARNSIPTTAPQTTARMA